MVYTVLGTGFEDYYNPAFCGVRGGEKGICDFDVEVALIYMIYVPFFIAPPFVLPGFIIYIASRLWGRCRRKPAASALDADPGRLTATMSSQGRLATAGSASLRPLLWYIIGCFSFGLLLALYSIVSMLLGKGFYGVESIGEYYDRDLCNVVPGNEGLIPTYPGYSCDINLKYAYLHLVYFAVTKSEEHTSELQSLMRISYAVFCLKKKNTHKKNI